MVSKSFDVGLRFGALLVALSAVGCTQRPSALPEPAIAIHAMSVCEGTLQSRYFPESAVRWLPQPSFGRNLDYAAQILDAMHESSFACGDVPESYRVLWLHSFSGWPYE